MRRRNARVLAVLLCLVMAGSLLSGCSGITSAGSGAGDAAGMEAEGSSSSGGSSSADSLSEGSSAGGSSSAGSQSDGSAAESSGGNIISGDADVSDYISEGEDVGPEIYTAPERSAVPFDEMTANLYDADAAEKAVSNLESLCEQPHTLKQIKENYDILIDQLDRIDTDSTLLQIRYDQNYNDTELGDQITQVQLQATDIADRILTALGKVLASPYGDAMKTYMNREQMVEEILNHTAMEQEEYDLEEEESKLIQEYDTLCEKEDEEGCAEIYLKLLDLRIAQMKYDTKGRNYAEYVYEDAYYRDYSPEDSAKLYTWAKETVVPWMREAMTELYTGEFTDIDEMFSTSYSSDRILERVAPFVTEVGDGAKEAWETMTGNDLIDLEVSDTKVDQGYTATLPYYGVPFIFTDPAGDATDIKTVIHEFGHYYQAFVNQEPQAYAYDCYDICEIDSQGMEVLMFRNADLIYGGMLGRTAVLYNLFDLLSAISEGCLFDEFQQKALAARMDGTLTTADQLTALYKEVEKSYYGNTGLGWGDSWYQVSHTFDQPFYYISYATSAAAALSLLSIAEDDYDQALSVYNQLIDMGCDQGYVNTLETLGIPDPLTEEGQEVLTESIGTYLEKVLE